MRKRWHRVQEQAVQAELVCKPEVATAAIPLDAKGLCQAHERVGALLGVLLRPKT